MPVDEPGSTAIVVLTPEAESITADWYRAHSKAGREGMRLHITLCVPFIPAQLIDTELEDRLRGVIGGFEAFDYALERLERWSGGILYLAPEPARPFVELTHALLAEFPSLSPYDGKHDEVVPHATVAVAEDGDLLARIASELEAQLPIACRVSEATVVERGADLRWRPRAAFALGG